MSSPAGADSARWTWLQALACAGWLAAGRALVAGARWGALEGATSSLVAGAFGRTFFAALAWSVPAALAAAWLAGRRAHRGAREPLAALVLPLAAVPLGFAFATLRLPALEPAPGLDAAPERLANACGLAFAVLLACWLSPRARRPAVLALPGLVALAALALAGAWAVASPGRSAWPQRPNAVLVSVDTLRADHVGCYGYDRPTTPNLDRFAESAVRFTDAHTPYPWTLIAHMSLLTSLYPTAHGVLEERALDPRVPTLAEAFASEGYATVAVVDSVVWLQPRYGFDRGFDYYRQLEGTAEEKLAQVGELLDELGDRPFFLFAHFFDVHSDTERLPYEADEEDRRLFAGDYAGEFDGCMAGLGCASELLRRLNDRGIQLEGAEREWLVDLYDAGVRSFDRRLGELFAALEERGLAERTVSVVTADHGESFFEHGTALHAGVFEETVSIPLLVRTPDTREGRAVDALVGLVDVAPTLLELCGIPDLRGQGRSLVPLLEGGETWPDRALLYDDGRGHLSLRTKDWKLVQARRGGRHLFHLATDPREATDLLAGEPPERVPRVLGELEERLGALSSETHALRERFARGAEATQLTGADSEALEALGYMGEE